jgi:serine/threonine protein kinase
MGEVYRARDTKLGRDVAVKILHEEFAGDPERLARFEREARALAAVNDPHIAHIYGLERQEGQDGCGGGGAGGAGRTTPRAVLVHRHGARRGNRRC